MVSYFIPPFFILHPSPSQCIQNQVAYFFFPRGYATYWRQDMFGSSWLEVSCCSVSDAVRSRSFFDLTFGLELSVWMDASSYLFLLTIFTSN